MVLTSIGQGASIAITINAVDKFSKTFKAASLGIGAVEASMKIAAIAIAATGVALATIGIASLKTAADFETAFTGVRKTVDLSEKKFEELENRFKEISKTTPIAFVEIAKIGELAGQLGVSGVDNIDKFARTIADLAVTTNLTAEQAATDFARFGNIMNMPIDQVDRLGSVVVDLGNNLATTEAEIVNMGLRISGAGKALGFTEGQVMAWGAALSSVGIRAEMGGTAISKLMINISSMVATGSEDLKGFADIAGMTVENFSKLFEEDASGALQLFFKGLSEVEGKGGNVLTTLEQLDIKEVRLRDAILRLSSSYGTLTDSLEIQGTAWEENIALTDEAQKKYDTFESKVKILKNTFSIFMEEIGKLFLPVMKDLVVILTKKVLPALEPLIPLFGEFFKRAIETVIPHLEGMSNKFVELATILLRDVIPNVMPLITIVGKILIEAFNQFFDTIKPILPVLGDLAKLIFDNAKEMITNLVPSVKSLVPVVLEFFESLKPLIPKLFELIEKLAQSAVVIIKEALPAISALVPIVMDVIDVIIDLIPTVEDIIVTLVNLTKNILEGAAPAIKVMKVVLLEIIEPIKTVIGWITDLLDLIGRFLGQSSSLSKTASDFEKARTSSSKKGDVLNVSPTTTTTAGKVLPTIYLNDFILSKGKLIKPSSQDTIIGTKNPEALGGITIYIEGDIYGTDPEQMAQAFGRELKRTIRI